MYEVTRREQHKRDSFFHWFIVDLHLKLVEFNHIHDNYYDDDKYKLYLAITTSISGKSCL